MLKLFISLLLISTVVSAKETVTIVYAWSPSDSTANYDRVLADEANKIQNKYTFLFDTKPGAGSSIATNYVANTPNTILATSSTLFIRPIFYPDQSYDINNFKELMPQCNAPLAISSVKYKSWKEVPTDRPLTIGTSGLGVTTHLTALQIVKKYPNIQVVPFKSTSDSLLSMVGGQTDLHVAFISEAEAWSKENTDPRRRVHVLGITGMQQIKQYPTLISNGFPSVLGSMSVPFHLVVPAKLPDDRTQEWRDILVKAAKSKTVIDTYAVDSCVPSNMSESEMQAWFRAQAVQWKKIGADVKLAK